MTNVVLIDSNMKLTEALGSPLLKSNKKTIRSFRCTSRNITVKPCISRDT